VKRTQELKEKNMSKTCKRQIYCREYAEAYADPHRYFLKKQKVDFTKFIKTI